MGEEIKILTIDDEESIRINFVEYFEDSGYTVFEAENGRIGLEVFEKEKPDLVLVDLNMPEMDGFEVLERITRESPGTPIIVVSGAGEIQAAIKATRLGAWDFIQKPVIDMGMVEHSINKSLERARLVLENKLYREYLEEQTLELSQTIIKLRDTQKQLVESEKMASLSRMVTGIAHEVNTPLGIGVTTASLLTDLVNKLFEDILGGTLKKSHIGELRSTFQETGKTLMANLKKTASLIQFFKKVAVDHTLDASQNIEVKKYLEEIIKSFIPQLEKSDHKIIVNCEPGLNIETFPRDISQIVMNLVTNSVIHAYDEGISGKLTFDIKKENESLTIDYSDDGKGIAKDNLGKIFDPFFTTSRGKGATGLGLHIVYNIVTHRFHGSIECESELGKGTRFYITLPNIEYVDLDDTNSKET